VPDIVTNKPLARFFADIKSTPEVLSSSYYPSLNGLRGIAIMMVLLDHLKLSDNLIYLNIFNGKLGVLIFFVLSGFLITTLCIKEIVATQTISLKDFYIRRVLRIFPVAYLFILVIIILNIVFKLGISYIQIFGAALYLMNFSSYFRKYNFTWDTAHFWSLAVEEQFYLIVPFILKKNFRVYLSLILLIVFALPFGIMLQYHFTFLDNVVFNGFTHYLIKFQAIAVGCFFSIMMFKYPVGHVLIKTKIIANILAVFLIFYIHYDNLFTVNDIFSGLAISLLIGYLIVSNIIPERDLIFRILNSKILNTIGVLSYSIYIWQQLFTSADSKLPKFMVVFPYNLFCIVAVSSLSYYFYESFFLRLKARYSKIKKDKLNTAAYAG
jgi:peptidoglycan/LPS O-acetylase OafA/YrhL